MIYVDNGEREKGKVSTRRNRMDYHMDRYNGTWEYGIGSQGRDRSERSDGFWTMRGRYYMCVPIVAVVARMMRYELIFVLFPSISRCLS